MELYVLCMAAGLIVLVGGLILVGKGKVLIDKETKQVVDIELPVLGKIKTNVPALVYFIMGVLMVLYPLHLLNQEPYADIQGQVRVSPSESVEVYVALGPDVIAQQKTSFALRVPFNTNVTGYHVLYISRNQVISHYPAPPPRVSGGRVNVNAEGAPVVEVQ